MNWKDWNWRHRSFDWASLLHDGVLLLALVFMRATWVWLWLALVERLAPSAYEGILLPLGWVIGLLLASTVITRWLSRRAQLEWARLAIAGLGLAVIFVVVWYQFFRPTYPLLAPAWLRAWAEEMIFWGDLPPRSLFLLPGVIYLWLRGILDGSRPLEHGEVLGAFTGGSLAIALFLLAGQLDSRALPDGTGATIFLFFGAAMVALALSSVKLAPMLQNGALTSPVAINRYWLGSVLGIISVLLALALLLSSIIAPETVAQLLALVWDGISQVLIFLFIVASIILYPVLYLLWLVLPRLVEAIRALFGGDSIFASLAEQVVALQPEEASQQTAASVPVELRWVALVVFILAVAVLFALVLRRWRRDRDNEVEETRESVFSSELLMAQLAGLWPRFLKRQPPVEVDPYLSLAGEVATRRSIRQIYQWLLAAASAEGQPRRPEQTPIGYGRELGERELATQEALDVITDRYIQARYDEAPPSMEQVEETRRAWEELSERMKDDGVTRET